MRKKAAKIIVIANQKGGCGKTTTSVHLACGLANLKEKPKVLLIDADSQQNSSVWAANKEKFNFNIILSASEMIELIDQNLDQYDYILIDCPPATEQSNDSIVVYGALLVADLLVISLLCSALDIWATGGFETTTEAALKENKELKIYLLLNKYEARLKRTKRSIELIRETIPYPILTTKIANRGAFVDSADFGVTVFELGDQKAITEVQQLTKEVIDVLERKENE